MTTDSTASWTAAFRSAVVSPHESIDLFELRAFEAQTLRQIIRLDGGGSALRIHLSNRYGKEPLHIGGARLARRTQGSGIDPGSDTALRVAGAEEFTIPAGEDLVTDPVEHTAHPGDELALTLWLPHDTGPSTYSAVPLRTGYAVPGNALTAPALDGTEGLEELATRHFISGADVLAPTGTPVIVAFGDSWFEGTGTTNDTDHRFPDLLNDRLRAAGHPGWVVNQGLSANRLLTDEIGEHALARLRRDALDVPGATHVLVHFGLNDLGIPGQEAYPEPAPLP
uniref:GDSL-type esterase/lipase family protein n=2 Tax=Streptomyces TaxID=1883 RepID=UPI0006EBB061